MDKEDNLDFSFSGCKSAVIKLVHHADQMWETLSRVDLAASFQAAVVDVCVHKTQKAQSEYPVKQLELSGGVSANQGQ